MIQTYHQCTCCVVLFRGSTLNRKRNATLLFSLPKFTSWIQTFSLHTKGLKKVWLGQPTVKGHSKIGSFITHITMHRNHKFWGSVQLACKNTHQSCCPWIECPFLHRKPSPGGFSENLAAHLNGPHNHEGRVTAPASGPPHPACSALRWSDTGTAAATKTEVLCFFCSCV